VVRSLDEGSGRLVRSRAWSQLSVVEECERVVEDFRLEWWVNIAFDIAVWVRLPSMVIWMMMLMSSPPLGIQHRAPGDLSASTTDLRDPRVSPVSRNARVSPVSTARMTVGHRERRDPHRTPNGALALRPG
jgi:hypothetical protein